MRCKCEVYPAALPDRTGQHLAQGGFQALVAAADHQLHPLQAALDQATQETQPEGAIFAGDDGKTQERPLTALPHPYRYDGGLADDAVVDAHLDVQGDQPDVRVAALQRPVAKRLDLDADPPAYAADFVDISG